MSKRSKVAFVVTMSLVLGCTMSGSVSCGTGGGEKIGTFMCADIKDGACVGQTDTFAATAEVVHLYFRTKAMPAQGDTYVIRWIAESVGDAAPPNTEITSVTLKVEQDPSKGANYLVTSNLTKPTKGWPVGAYRVEVKRGDKLETTATFSIK